MFDHNKRDIYKALGIRDSDVKKIAAIFAEDNTPLEEKLQKIKDLKTVKNSDIVILLIMMRTVDEAFITGMVDLFKEQENGVPIFPSVDIRDLVLRVGGVFTSMHHTMGKEIKMSLVFCSLILLLSSGIVPYTVVIELLKTITEYNEINIEGLITSVGTVITLLSSAETLKEINEEEKNPDYKLH